MRIEGERFMNENVLFIYKCVLIRATIEYIDVLLRSAI